MKNRTKKILNEVSSMIKTSYPFLNESERMDMLENFVCRCLEVGIQNEFPENSEEKINQQDRISPLSPVSSANKVAQILTGKSLMTDKGTIDKEALSTVNKTLNPAAKKALNLPSNVQSLSPDIQKAIADTKKQYPTIRSNAINPSNKYKIAAQHL